MSLIDEMMTNCTILDKASVPDGMGGFTYNWVEGSEFKAAIVKDNTIAARVAEKQGVAEVYTVTVNSNVTLDFHDVFKRVEDGAIFRVTSNIADSRSPKAASFKIGQVTAERWELE